MKKYVIIVVLSTCLHLLAESNPFNLQANLEKIDKNQDALLYELKKLSKKSKKKEIPPPKNKIDSSIVELPKSKSIILDKNVDLNHTDNKEHEKASLLKMHEKHIEVEKHRAKLLAEKEQLKKDLEMRKAKKEKTALEKRELIASESKKSIREEKKRLKIKKDADTHIDSGKEEHIKKQNTDEEYLKAIAEVK